MIGVTDGRVAQCKALGVTIRSNSFAKSDTILADKPDVLIMP
jgi:hypothetical protein